MTPEALDEETENERRKDLSERGPLVDAYNLVTDPKPSLGVVIGYVREKKLEAVNVGGVFYVSSVLDFAEALENLMKRHSWTPALGNSPLPDGYVFVLDYLRSRIAFQKSKAAGILTGADPGSSAIADRAKNLLLAGDVPSAKKGPKGWWIAEPDALRAWVWRHWQLDTK
jgi:hypothetical protein